MKNLVLILLTILTLTSKGQLFDSTKYYTRAETDFQIMVSSPQFSNVIGRPNMDEYYTIYNPFGFVITEGDADSLNERQYLTLDNTYAITLSKDGGTVYIPTPTLVVSGNSLYTVNGNTVTLPAQILPYTNTATVSSGVAIFYLTSDKTSTGTALYTTNGIYPNPIVNDATTNYQYGWTISTDKKTMTVTVNKTVITLGLLNTTAVANGVIVRVRVDGN